MTSDQTITHWASNCIRIIAFSLLAILICCSCVKKSSYIYTQNNDLILTHITSLDYLFSDTSQGFFSRIIDASYYNKLRINHDPGRNLCTISVNSKTFDCSSDVLKSFVHYTNAENINLGNNSTALANSSKEFFTILIGYYIIGNSLNTNQKLNSSNVINSMSNHFDMSLFNLDVNGQVYSSSSNPEVRLIVTQDSTKKMGHA